MHAGRHYRLWEFLLWTRRDMFAVVALAAIPTLLFMLLDWKWLAIPWVPVALVGTAAAFLVGFKNTQTYNRSWEARTIYGGIVNTSRAWGMMSVDLIHEITGNQLRKQLIYNHIAWLTALRYQLREPRAWESNNLPHNAEYRKLFPTPEHLGSLKDELSKLLETNDLETILSKKNRATHLIHLQSKILKTCLENKQIDALHHVEMERLLVECYELQGKCERIKNFPYPRQFATINLFFVRLFVMILPFGMLQEFHKMGENYAWLTIPITGMVGWIFLAMDKIGESTENPFEGGANDVPITALSRTIEIDLREMLGETELPPAAVAVNQILM